MIKRILLLTLLLTIMVFAFFNPISLHGVLASGKCDYLSVSSGDCEVVEMVAADFDKVKDILNLEIVSSREISGRTIIEGYSNKLKENVVIDNRKVNIQMSICGDKMIVGYPLINGSF